MSRLAVLLALAVTACTEAPVPLTAAQFASATGRDANGAGADVSGPGADGGPDASSGFIPAVCVGAADDCHAAGAVALGNVAPGASATARLEIANSGDLAGALSGVALTGEYLSWTIAGVGAESLPLALAPGAPVVLELLLSPGAGPGALAPASITLSFDGAGDIVLAVSATITECAEGTASCDDSWATGCETGTLTSVEHCGGCQHPCGAVNGTAGCEAGECGITCDATFEPVALTDDFGSGSLLGWSPLAMDAAVPGAWESAAGVVSQTAASEQAQLVRGAPDLADYAFKASIRAADDGWVGLVFRRGDDAWYRFRISRKQGQAALHRVTGQVEKPLWEGLASFEANVWFPLEVIVQGARIQVRKDGVELLDVTDGAGALSMGRVGLYTGQGGTASFDDVAVSLIGACAGHCASDPCAHGVCQPGISVSVCACEPGWRGDACDEDVDECVEGLLTCDPHATCVNAQGSAACECNDGWTGDGATCTDVDECSAGTGDCQGTASCVNTDGGYECKCPPGFIYDAGCQNLDECALGTHDCHADATCQDTDGSWTCTCKPGYAGSGQDCQDIDECMGSSSPCDPVATCTNAIGTYSCACPAGYAGDGATCSDVNECDAPTSPCSGTSTCENLPGTFMCACPTGLEYSGQDCVDILECSLGLNDCDTNAACIEQEGGFECVCNAGYVGDGTACSDIDECTEAPDGFDPRTVSGLVAWLDAADASSVTLDGDRVTAWADKSGQGNDAAASAGRGPAMRTSAHFGRSLLRFGGGESIGGGSAAAANTFDVFIVARPDGEVVVPPEAANGEEAAQQLVWAPERPEASARSAGLALGTDGAVVYEGSTNAFAPVAAVAHPVGADVVVVTVRYTDKQASVYVGADLVHTGLVSPGNPVQPSLRFGGVDPMDPTRLGFVGELGEVLIFDRQLTADEIVAVRGYLQAKWFGPCDRYGVCTNAPGTYSCACPAGFSGDGVTCQDADECAGGHDCTGFETCANTPGAWTCDCAAGFAPAPVLEDDFADNVLDAGWAFEGGGTWDETGGALVESAGGQGTSFGLRGSASWTDVTVEATVQRTSGSGAVGLIVRGASTGPRYYAGEVDADATRLVWRDGAQVVTLASGQGAAGLGLDPSQPIRLAVSARGTRLRVSVNHQVVVDHEDKRLQAIPSGRAGVLRVDGTASFDDLRVRGGACSDVDECADGLDDCDVHATCANTEGAFTCACDTGWAGSGTSCDDVDECVHGTHDCAPTVETCVNTAGAWACPCAPGYAGVTGSCQDVDECAAPVTSVLREGGGSVADATDAVRLECGFPDTNLDGGVLCVEPSLLAYAGVCGASLIGYFQLFGADSGQVPPGAHISSATLTLEVKGPTHQPYENELHVVKVPWTEATATYGSFWAGSQPDIEYDSAPVATVAFDAGNPFVMDVTSAVQAWADGAPNYGFVLFPASASPGLLNGVFLSSDDDATGSARPRLTVTWSLNDCHPDATCENSAGTYACACKPGFSGDGRACTNIDDCAPNPCQNGGTCTDGVQSYTCACADGYAGASCETEINECDPEPCKNGGTCTDLVAAFSCACAEGWTGTTCAENIDDCAPNPCQGGGAICTDGIAAFTCSCMSGWDLQADGLTCLDIDECATGANNCDDIHGTCANVDGGFTCGCVAGWKLDADGATCIDVDECADGTHTCAATFEACNNTDGSFFCTCAPGWMGDACKQCVRFVQPTVQGTGDGRSWENASALQSAIDDADAEPLANGCEIWVAQGTYYAHGGSEDDTFQLKPDIALYGGFAGDETVRDNRDWVARTTVLDGHEGPAETVDVYQVVTAAAGATLDGFTVTGGRADGTNNSNAHGGGIIILAAGVTVANCIVTGNTATGSGGGIYAKAASLTITGTLVASNTAALSGGGVYLNGSDATVVDSIFRQNRSAGVGGGVYMTNAAGTFARVVFDRNSALRGGGVLKENNPGPSSFQSCTFVGNRCGASGGGMHIETGQSDKVTSCLFVGNHADGSGGAAFISGGNPGATFTSCTIVLNRSELGNPDTGGGGLRMRYGRAVVNNSLVFSNEPDDLRWTGYNGKVDVAYSAVGSANGGGSFVCNNDGFCTDGGGNITSDPLFENVPLTVGITAALSTLDTITVANSGLYAVGDVIEIDVDGVARTVTQSLLGDVTFTPPLSATVAASTIVWNWGPGVTDVEWDVHLRPGSPAIDAANGDVTLPTDFVGNPRADDPDTVDTGIGATPWVDMGALEYQPPAL